MTRRKKVTRQAQSIARIRVERRARGLCTICGEKVAVKKLRAGGTKRLTKCETHLINDAMYQAKSKGKI